MRLQICHISVREDTPVTAYGLNTDDDSLFNENLDFQTEEEEHPAITMNLIVQIK